MKWSAAAALQLYLDMYKWHVQQNHSNKPYQLRVVDLLHADVQVAQLPHWINSDWLNIFKTSVFLPARWKTTRSQLTPAFSLGKIKPYFPLIVEVCEELKNCIESSCKFSCHAGIWWDGGGTLARIFLVSVSLSLSLSHTHTRI